jgi:hypothetical protein
MKRRKISRVRIFDPLVDNPTSVDGHEYAATRSFPVSKKLNGLNSPLSEESKSLTRDETIPADYKGSYGIRSSAFFAFSSGDDIDDLKYLINRSPDI